MPPANAESWLFGVIATLFLAAIAALVVDPKLHAAQQQQSRQFQELVHGLGLGPALDLSICEFAFDPRMNRSCPWDGGRTPGGVHFCPHHSGSILWYRRFGEP